MCTLSWIRRDDGYHLFFNRDERPTRAPGVPPAPGVTGPVRWLAPRDGDSGGTWIGANDRGVSLALLNRYHESPVGGDGPWISRGLLVLGLLDAGSVSDVAQRLDRMDRAVYQPFTLAAFAPGTAAALFAWNGRHLVEDTVPATGLAATSSGASQAEADRIRGGLFARWPDLPGLPRGVPGAPSPEDYEQLHASHWPERGPWSVCMHRPEAGTVSFTRIDVHPERVDMIYVPGPPGETRDRLTTTLARSTT